MQAIQRGKLARRDMDNKKAAVAELKTVFDKLDKNGSGTIDKKEWGKALKENYDTLSVLFGGASIADLGKKFNIIDEDGSGDLSWKEVTSACVLELDAGAAGEAAPEEKKAE